MTIITVEEKVMTDRRKLLLAVAALAVAVFVASPLVGAAHVPAHVVALDGTAVIGSTTSLGIEVGPMLVGGTGDLLAECADGRTLRLGKFALTDVSFVLEAPVPAYAGGAGEALTYYFRSCDGMDGATLVVSNGALVLLTDNGTTDEPPIWE